MRTITKQFGMVAFATFIFLVWSETASAFYHPQMQRWINRDPLMELGFESIKIHRFAESPVTTMSGANVYEFVDNNPMFEVDPLGLQIIILPPFPIPPRPSGGCSVADVAKCTAQCRRNGSSGSCYMLTVYIPLPCGGLWPIRVPTCICWGFKPPPIWF